MQTTHADEPQARLPELDSTNPREAEAQPEKSLSETEHAQDAAPAEAADEPASEEPTPERAAEEHAAPSARDALIPDRKRIEAQLMALKDREAQLRRELAMADHPHLADAIRQLEACAYSVTRADGKLAEGLTKAEEKRRDSLSKKLRALKDKRDKLTEQIDALDAELSGLGEERLAGFRTERRQALERLVTSLGAHTAEMKEAGLDAADLVPQIAEWMPEIRVVAKELAAQRQPGE